MRTPIMVLAAAAVAATASQVGGSSTALPPVTIIEIPEADDSAEDSPTIDDPQGSRTTLPSSETTLGPDPESAQDPPATIPAPVTPATVQPSVSTPGAFESPADWSSARRAGIVALVGMVLALGWVLYRLTLGVVVGPARSRRESLTGILKRRAEKYEAVQFVNRTAHLGPAVVEDRLGEFDHLEDAIAAARSAWAEFKPTPNRPEAWWIVRAPGSLRVDWIAESGSTEERVIDLRAPSGAHRATTRGSWKPHHR